MFPFSIQGLIMLLAAMLVAGLVVELIRRRRLRESFAMLWLGVAAVFVLFGVFPGLLTLLAGALNLYYLTTAGLIGSLFLILIILQLSVALSRQADENRRLTQRLALIQERLERLERDATEPAEASQREQRAED